MREGDRQRHGVGRERVIGKDSATKNLRYDPIKHIRKC